MSRNAMTEHAASNERLMHLAEGGYTSAQQTLLAMHRERLRRMVAARMNDKLAARFDPSDVVQDALALASRKLPEYLQHQSPFSVPLYPVLDSILEGADQIRAKMRPRRRPPNWLRKRQRSSSRAMR